MFVYGCAVAGSHHELSSWGNIRDNTLVDLGAKDPASIVHEYQVNIKHESLAALVITCVPTVWRLK